MMDRPVEVRSVFEILSELSESTPLRSTQLSLLAEKIVAVLERDFPDKERLADQLKRRFVLRLAQSCTTGDRLLSDSMRYATRLSAFPGDLSYEELHKLYSLCETVEALQALGFLVAKRAAEMEFKKSLSERLARDRNAAILVAEDRSESGKKMPAIWIEE